MISNTIHIVSSRNRLGILPIEVGSCQGRAAGPAKAPGGESRKKKIFTATPCRATSCSKSTRVLRGLCGNQNFGTSVACCRLEYNRPDRLSYQSNLLTVKIVFFFSQQISRFI